MRHVLFTLVLTAGCIATAQADVMTTQTGNGADSYVRFGSHANGTNGNADKLDVRTHPNNNADFVRWTYLRFDISSATSTPNGASGTGTHETLVLMYALGDNPGESDFVEAGRTTIRGGDYITRDIPLVTIKDLQALDQSVTFRIHGWNFNNESRTFRLDSVELHGIPEPTTALLLIGASALLLRRNH